MNSENQQESENEEELPVPLLGQDQLDALIDMLMSNNKFVNAIITRVMNSGLVGNAILKTPHAAQALTKNSSFISAVGTAADVYIQLNGPQLLMDSYKSAAPKKTQSNPFAKAPAAIFKRSGEQTATSSTPAKKKAKVSTPVETVNLDDGTGSEGEEQDQTTVSSAKVKTRAAREKRVIDEYVSNIKGRIAKDEADLAHKLNSATQLEGDEKIHFLGQVHAYIR